MDVVIAVVWQRRDFENGAALIVGDKRQIVVEAGAGETDGLDS